MLVAAGGNNVFRVSVRIVGGGGRESGESDGRDKVWVGENVDSSGGWLLGGRVKLEMEGCAVCRGGV